MDMDLYDAIQQQIAPLQRERPVQSWRKPAVTLGVIAISFIAIPQIGWLLAALFLFVLAVRSLAIPSEDPTLELNADVKELMAVNADLVICYASARDLLVLRSRHDIVQPANPLNEPHIEAALTPTDHRRLRAVRFRLQPSEIWVDAGISREDLAALITLADVLVDVRAGLIERALSTSICDAVCALVHLDAENAVPQGAQPNWHTIARAGRTGEDLAMALRAVDPICGALALHGLQRSDVVDANVLAEANDALTGALPDGEVGWMQRWAWSRALGGSDAQSWHRWVRVAGRATASRLHELEPLLSPLQRKALRRKILGDGQLSLSTRTAGQLTEVSDRADQSPHSACIGDRLSMADPSVVAEP